MVAQHFERLPHHADEAELLRGGLLLSYGLHREAGEIFARLIEAGAPAPVRDRAWFYLAKIRYQRGYLAEAEEALERIGEQLPGGLEDERRLLHANVLMARGEYARAVEVLSRMPRQSDALLYGRYNLGVALIKADQAEQGTALLEEVGRAKAGSEELRSLRDKANVALGYAALQGGAPERARDYLERVRLSGMLANKALLGFGWAYAALERPKDALVPWMELAQRDTADAAVLEAKLAVPYALGKLGVYGQSLQLYENAIAVFDEETARLDASIAAIRAGKLLDSLLARNPGEEMGWFWSLDQLPEMPHGGHLAQVLAQHDFQEALKNYRDLLFVGGSLDQWAANLAVYRDMLANRRQAYEERLPRVVAQGRGLGLGNYERERDRLAAELERVEAKNDVFAFADEQEQAATARLNRVRAVLERDKLNPELDEAREKYRRLYGALRWRVSSQFAARLWEARKGLKALDSELAEARRRNDALAQAQQDEPARFERFAARIAELEQRVTGLGVRVAELASGQKQYVENLAIAELERQKLRVATYVTQARFAVAQIYDQASRAEDTHAAAP
jgi:hypothetical protein